MQFTHESWSFFRLSLGLKGDDVMLAYFLNNEKDKLICLDQGLSGEVDADEGARIRLLGELRDVWAAVEDRVN